MNPLGSVLRAGSMRRPRRERLVLEPLEPRVLLSVGGIELGRGIDYEVPRNPLDDHHEYWVIVSGTGITDVQVTTPWGYSIGLDDLLPPNWTEQDVVELDRGAIEFSAGEEDGLPTFEFSWELLTDAQWASLDTGQTTIAVTYTGGTWNASLDFSGLTQFTREPNPTSPLQREVVSDDPTFRWASWGSPPSGALIYVELSSDELDFDVAGELSRSATSW